ncbi:hypothetical protein ACPCAJ_12245 [Streptomyces griseoincarnatus]
MTTSSERARKATELIRFLTGRQSERCLLEAGFAATRASAYGRALRCPAEISAVPAPSPTGEADEVPRGDEGRPGLTDAMLGKALEQAVHRPRTPLCGAFTQTLITQLGPLVESGSANQDALARSLDEALRRALPG